MVSTDSLIGFCYQLICQLISVKYFTDLWLCATKNVMKHIMKMFSWSVFIFSHDWVYSTKMLWILKILLKQPWWVSCYVLWVGGFQHGVTGLTDLQWFAQLGPRFVFVQYNGPCTVVLKYPSLQVLQNIQVSTHVPEYSSTQIPKYLSIPVLEHSSIQVSN